MAVINDPTTASYISRVGPVAFQPFHTLPGPFPILNGGAYRLSMKSSNITAGLASDSEVFQFRYVTSAGRVCLVFGVSVSLANNVAATAASNNTLELFVARSWSAAGSSGTRATLTGNNNKLRSNHATSEVNDAGIISTTALTAGTKTLDAQPIGSVAFSFVTGAITVQLNGNICPKTNLLGEFSGGLGWPLVLTNQEGFVIRNGVAFPAGATPRLSVDVLWTEAEAF